MASSTAPAQIRAWQVSGPGNIIDNIKLASLPRPTESSLGPRDVLIEVIAAGVNPADYKLIGLGQVSRFVISYPKIPGMDLAGRVVAVGAEVPKDVKVGDSVIARMDPLKTTGSLAEYLIADYDGVAALPANVTPHQAGAAATTALTAYQTIAPYVKAGDKVFINGGSGGTGTFGIQIAKALGCHVTATCSTAKIPLCKELGADEIIDYKTTDVVTKLRELGKVFAVVVDNVGNSPANLYAASDAFLLSTGHYKFVGGAINFATARSLIPSSILPSFLGGAQHKLETFLTKNSHEDLAAIAKWMGEGKVKTIVDSVYGFDEVPAAYTKLKEGSAAGKIVIHVQKE
ncbi:reticulon-4-interacting protein [Plectosphaerella plurivora]|uniref:Reticulon-4-interacting protein n=1 Tax=Plectosphaerella plurivora TaxID=936078 RepID=A0A9P9AGL9_9PEZI|nr:reticulon-4-interacting protein [Plectosphaerella plurivora]